MKRLLFSLALLLPTARLALPATALTCGQSQVGNLTAQGAVFNFSAQAGDIMLIRLFNQGAGVAFGAPVLQDPNGLTIKFRNTGRESFGFFVYDIQTAGNYQYTVTGSAGGSFQIVYVPLNRACGGNTTLTCGTPLKGQVQPGQLQTYQFNGKAGDYVSLRAATTAATVDPAASLAVIGFDSAGHIQTTGPGQDLFSSFRGIQSYNYRLTTDGQQTFVIGEAQGTKAVSYALNMIDLNGSCNATAVGCGIAADASINDVLSTGIYTVSASKGDVYQLKLVTNDATGGLQPNLQVYDAQGAPLAPSSTEPTRLLFTMPSDGAFTFLVQDGSGTGGTGTYSLSLLRLNRPCNATGPGSIPTQPLGCGTPTSGQINGPLRFQIFSLDAQTGDVYMLRLLRTGSNPSFAPRIDVYGPGSSAQIVNVRTSDLGSVTFTAPASGTYSLIAYDDSDGKQSGSFTVWRARLNGPCDGSIGLSCNFLAPGTISQALQTGIYSYPTSPGDAFTVRLLDTGGSLQTAMQVFDPRGNAIQPAPGGAKAVDVTNSQGGTYTILVSDQSRTVQQGTFAVQAFNTRGSCGGNPPQGQGVSGLISGSVPFNSYVFSASAGDALLVRSAAFTGGFTANVDLYDPNGRRVGTGTSSVSPPVLAASGPYTAIVSASAARSAGSYAFSWQLLNNPVAPPLQCGQTVSGSLGAANQFWYYSVAANDSDLLKLLLTRLPGTLNAQVELFDPKGVRQIASTGDIVRKVSGGGSYLVLVSPASSAAESGGFALSLQRPNNPCSATALACGQTILQQSSAAGQLDAFTFSASSGDRIAITVTPRQGSYNPVTELYDQASTNNVAVPGSPGGTTLNANLTATSQYTLTVHDRVGNTGSYRVALQRTTNACPENDTEKPVVSLRRPTGGDVIAGGAVFQILWQSDDNIAVASHAIRLSTDGGKTFTPITGAAALSGVAQSFPWVVPNDVASSRQAMIQVTATDRAGNSQAATSDLLTLIGSGFAPNAQVTYQYDPLNRLVQATYQDGRVVSYTYDAAGNLATVTVQ